MIQIVVAFVGGTLSLFSPCSALLVPSFFAYAFADRRRLVLRTGIFYAGLLTLFIPLGLGVGELGSLIRDHLGAVTGIAGSLLILIGIFQIAVGGFKIPGVGKLAGVGSESAVATYVLGLVYGVGGFCSGPILAGILTLATASGRPVAGAFLLAAFGLGMTLPLFILALAWGKLGRKRTHAMRARSFRIGPIERHWSIVASSAIFIALGVAFIAFRGANVLSGLYERAGASDTVFRLEQWVNAHGTQLAISFAGLAITVASLRALLRIRRHPREQTDAAQEDQLRRSGTENLASSRYVH